MEGKTIKAAAQKLLSGEKSVKLLLLIGLSGVLLLCAASFSGGPKGKTAETQTPSSSELSAEDYEERLRQELTRIVSAITGEEAPAVMVTLESAGQSVYAQDEKNGMQTETEGGSSESERTHVILKDPDGAQQALPVMKMQPEVKGVVIVSNCAGDPVVRERLVNAAKTALGVSASRVCVTCGR